MDTIVIYAPTAGPRLQYVVNWLLAERLQLPFTITTKQEDLASAQHSIVYGQPLADRLSIPAEGLLSEKGIRSVAPPKGIWNELPVLFASDDNRYSLPFDIFSAIFFLLSRYEEYDRYTPDKHGRYPATCSLLHKNGWLQRPLVDEWVNEFRVLLGQYLNITVPTPAFRFQPTYDIDIAYSYRHKGSMRTIGAYARALLRLDIKGMSRRTDVLRGRQKDPYDSFRWLRQQHKEYGYSPTYFILAALHTTDHDKNIPPTHPAMVHIIHGIAKEGNFGIHPSYYSDSGDVLQQERSTLEQVAGRNTTLSRQHYIRAILPRTYRALLAQGITDDHSMGYGAHLGFRAGTGSSFLWYDLENEATTALRVHPFCFMDTTAHFENKLNAQQAFEKLAAMARLLQRTGSTLTTVFHNFSLGTDDQWRGWKQAYEQFLQQCSVK